MLKFYIENNFTTENLTFELYRLFNLFVPYEELPDIRVVVEDCGEGKAALATFDPPTITMYRDYHEKFPQEYKITLLQEAGHFLYSKDHSNFKIYYEYLNLRQAYIDELVVPDSYEKFLYCSVAEEVNYKLVCSSCRNTKLTSALKFSKCELCNTSMLLVEGL